MTTKKRHVIFLTDAQKAFLRAEAFRLETSVSDLIRSLIERYRKQQTE